MSTTEFSAAITLPRQRPALLKTLCDGGMTVTFNIGPDRLQIVDGTNEFITRRGLQSPSDNPQMNDIFHVSIGHSTTGNISMFMVSATTGEIVSRRTMSKAEIEDVLTLLGDFGINSPDPAPKYPELPPPTDEVLNKALSSRRTRLP